MEPGALSRELLAAARSGASGGAEVAALSGQLQGIDPAGIEGDAARIAFWINLYNALLLERLRERPVRGSIARHPRLFSTAAYDVGGRPHTLNLIEHGLLRRNRRPPLHARRPLRRSDPRLAAAPSRLDPRIHFALNCGARSCPPIRAYEEAELDSQLEAATAAYLGAESSVDRTARALQLPGLMRLYAGDFGDREAQVAFAAARLPEVGSLLGDGMRVAVGYASFDWSVAR